MNTISIFDKVLGRFKKNDSKFSAFKFFMDNRNQITKFGEDIYASSTARACINSIATNTAKLSGRHLTGSEQSNNLKFIQEAISIRPNPQMNAFSFYQKVVTQYCNKNNAFILVERENNALNLYPIDYSTVLAVEAEGELFLKFRVRTGNLTIPYSDIIHLRNHFYDDDFFGEDNKPLLQPLETMSAIEEGTQKSIQAGTGLKGIIKYNTMLRESDIDANREKFIASFSGVENSNGIGALDSKADFIELKSDMKIINPIQAKAIKEKVYEYFHTNENIIQCKYTEDEWNAFYESTIEPISMQMSQEFTYKIFTRKERGFGNKIVFESSTLQYASVESKIKVVNTLVPFGILTLNEAREVFNLGPIEGDGDKRLISLNYVDANAQNQYQLGGDIENEDGKENTEE